MTAVDMGAAVASAARRTKDIWSLAPLVDVTLAVISWGDGLEVEQRGAKFDTDVMLTVYPAGTRSSALIGGCNGRVLTRHASRACLEHGRRAEANVVRRRLDETPQNCVAGGKGPLFSGGRDRCRKGTEYRPNGEADHHQGDQKLYQGVSGFRMRAGVDIRGRQAGSEPGLPAISSSRGRPSIADSAIEVEFQ